MAAPISAARGPSAAPPARDPQHTTRRPRGPALGRNGESTASRRRGVAPDYGADWRAARTRHPHGKERPMPRLCAAFALVATLLLATTPAAGAAPAHAAARTVALTGEVRVLFAGPAATHWRAGGVTQIRGQP